MCIRDSLYSIVWTVLNLSVGIAALYAYRLDRRMGEKRLSLLIVVFVIIGYLGIGMFRSVAAIGFIFVFYCFRGIATPVLKDYVNKRTTADVRATVLSVRNFIIRLLFSTVGPLVGWITDVWSLSAGLIIAGCIYGLLGGWLVLRFHGEGK